MSGLTREAREAIEEGFRLDAPSDERRARIKARLALALASGTAALGGSAAAAEMTGAIAVGGVIDAIKRIALGSLLAWFGVGAAAGVGVSGVVAVVDHATVRRAAMKPPVHAAAADPGSRTPAVSPGRSARVPLSTTLLPVQSPAFAADSPPAAKALLANTSPLTNTSPLASTTSSLTEEAALLGQSERALAANEPNRALESLAEHERRFPEGALREERQAARVLALCELGRVEDARVLARQFVTKSPGSVLVPRLEHSCAGPL